MIQKSQHGDLGRLKKETLKRSVLLFTSICCFCFVLNLLMAFHYLKKKRCQHCTCL
ncbi:hypothetical protein NDU88_003333 [Pleurodeles waltl]|uniref:Uncharacterized protein n=1 Tax=Pleurodeles waltl TaxID=8319 RepID=A0AAV7PBT4_PLEWA|nr:hypothetical protein NDU88_003333 [Pleurodeles waltl]